MIYKFDILFKKSLKSGGLKVVTYSSLLENPEEFGKGEGFADAEGELSMVLEGPEEGFSINALYRKYRAQLVGKVNADMLGKDFSLLFVFAKANDPYSIKMALRTEDGNVIEIETDAFELMLAKDSDCTITCAETQVKLQRGQAVFTTIPATQLTIEPAGANLIRVI